MGFRPDRLKIARERRGLSQRALGRILELNANQINRYEQGLTDPSTPILAHMAEVLGVTADYLIGLSDLLEPPPSIKLPPQESRLLEAFIIGDAKTVVNLLSERLRQLDEGEDGG